MDKYKEAEKLIHTDKNKYRETVDEIIKLLDISGYDEDSENYKKYVKYIQKKIQLSIQDNESKKKDQDTDEEEKELLDIYGGNDEKTEVDDKKIDEKEEKTEEEDEKKKAEEEEKKKEEEEEKRKEEEKVLKGNLIDFIEDLKLIKSDIEKQLENYKQYTKFTKSDKPVDTIDKNGDKSTVTLGSNIDTLLKDIKALSNFNDIDRYVNFLSLLSSSDKNLEKKYIDTLLNLQIKLQKINFYIENNIPKYSSYKKYKGIELIIKKLEENKDDNLDNVDELKENLISNKKSISEYLQDIESQKKRIKASSNDEHDKEIKNINLIIGNINENINDNNNSFDEIVEKNKNSILAKTEKEIVKYLATYIEHLSNILKKIEKKGNNNSKVASNSNDINKTSIYNRIWNKYVEDVKDESKIIESSQDKFHKSYVYNNLDASEVLKLTLDDKLIFVVISFCIRQIILSVIREQLQRLSMGNHILLKLITKTMKASKRRCAPMMVKS
jgi:hypothetical protein